MHNTAHLTEKARQGDPQAQFLLAGSLFSSGLFDQAREWLEKSVKQDFHPALYQQAVMMSLGQHCEENPQAAMQIFQRLAEKENLEAMRTLANLYSCGLIAGDDWDRARQWFVNAFLKGHVTVIREAAVLLKICGHDNDKWLPLLAKAANYEDATAQFLYSQELTRSGNKHLGQWYLQQADKGGHPQARETRAGQGDLDQPPEGAGQDLPLNFQEVVAALKALPAPKTESGKKIFELPEAYVFNNTFSKLECDYLMVAASPHLNPAIVYNTNSLKEEKNPVRTNESATFHFPKQDFVINYLTRKMVAMSGEPLENAEHLVVLKYREQEEYHPHFDYLDPAVPGLKEEVEKNGQRIKTTLVYLNDDYQGGETEFVHIGEKFKGQKGEGLLFHNVLANGDICKESQHAGCPIKEGVKWLAVKWIRNKPLKTLV